MRSPYVYIFIMTAVTFAIRAIPMTFIQKRIKNVFIQSFLYYVPYVTLAVMTFPSVIYATRNPVSGAAAFIVGLITAWKSGNLFKVAVSCCAAVLLTECLMSVLGIL